MIEAEPIGPGIQQIRLALRGVRLAALNVYEIRPQTETLSIALGGRLSFMAISNRFLLKGGAQQARGQFVSIPRRSLTIGLQERDGRWVVKG